MNELELFEGEIQDGTHSLLERIRIATSEDEDILQIVSALEGKSVTRVKNYNLAKCTRDGALFRYRDKIVAPQKISETTLTTDIIRNHHDSPVAGH